jgi:hypothetical protein
MMTKLTLSWEFPEAKGAVLTFDKAAWALFQAEAAKESASAEELISVTVARLVGAISRYRLRK